LNQNQTGAYNLAIGPSTMMGANTGSYNSAIGPLALENNTSGADNMAIGLEALLSNTTGIGNTAIGYLSGITSTAGNANVSGNNNTWIGGDTGPGTATQLSNTVGIGVGARNTASNQTVIGTSGTTSFIAYGTRSEAGSAPTPSAGTLVGSENGGYVYGLAGATTLTLNFAVGWSTWASCVANTSSSATQPYVSAISKSAVTFTMAALTGTLYYHCTGQ